VGKINLDKAKETLTGAIREEYNTAVQLSVQQGSVYPLIQFYHINERELSERYGISINDLLGINTDMVEMMAGMATPTPPPKIDILTAYVYPIAGIIAGVVGISLIFKTLKK
jgi:hypothetical protein